MNGLTRFFLVLLRLAIGWHFLFEGLEKIDSVNRGPTETSRPFSSEGYLREATGPLGGLIRSQLGDPDEAALERLTLLPLQPDQDPARIPVHQRLSPVLDRDWDAYLERFASHYQIDDQQRRLAEAKLQQSKDQAVLWLLGGSKDVEINFPSTTTKVKQTTAQRIQNYKDKLQQPGSSWPLGTREMEDRELSAFGRDVEKQRLRSAKADAARMRSELLAELNQPMRDALDSVLTPEQKKKGPVPEARNSVLVGWTLLECLDALTRWGLVAVGLGLLLGLFTRTACLGGAAFLLLLYLTVAPFPWLPEATRVEGHYYFVNKNLVEMLALLALATTHSGRWVGLDGLVRYLNPLRWRRA
jgi:uncharacterized membrane protein YphA (DoxX/SURF4 family)